MIKIKAMWLKSNNKQPINNKHKMAKAKETVVNRQSFGLQKVKLIPKQGGLEIVYTKQSRSSDDIIIIDSFTRKCPKVPHPDLIKCLEKMDKMLARVYGLNSIDVVRKSGELSGDEVEAFKKLKRVIDGIIKNQIDRISVTGVAISGQEKNVGVIITGKYATDNGIDAAVNTCRIKLFNEKFGFESDLAELIDDITEEVFCYLFEDKRADPELFQGGDEDEEPEENDGSEKAKKKGGKKPIKAEA